MNSRADGGSMRRLAGMTIAATLLIAVGLTFALSGSSGPLQSIKAFAYGTAAPTKPPTTPLECEQRYGDSDQGDQCVAGLKRSAALKRCAKKPEERKSWNRSVRASMSTSP